MDANATTNNCILCDWQFWLSVITAFIAIIALFQTNRQTKLSNKHQLFDRRLKNYILLDELLVLYSKNRDNLVNKKFDDLKIETALKEFTDTKSLTEFCINVYNKNFGERINISINTCNMLMTVSQEVNFLWKNEGEIFSEFIRAYCNVLEAMIKQQYYIDAYIKDKYNKDGKLDECKILLDKNAIGLGLYEYIATLDDCYSKIIKSGAKEKLIKTIRF